jgi:hypothetical protein
MSMVLKVLKVLNFSGPGTMRIFAAENSHPRVLHAAPVPGSSNRLRKRGDAEQVATGRPAA